MEWIKQKVNTNASNVAVGVVLSKEIDGREGTDVLKHATFKSRANFCVTHKELLAVVDATKLFHKYLKGQNFIRIMYH